MREKTTGQVFKQMLPWIFVVGLISGILTGLLDLAGLPLFQVVTYDFMSGKIVAAPNLVVIIIVSLVYTLFTSLLGKGLYLAIYRNIRYDTQISFEDLFFFFNKNILFNLGFVLVESILIGLAFVVFVIPGIIVYMGLFPSAVWMAKAQEDRSIKEVLKNTWASTKGKKGSIFIRFLLVGIIFVVLSVLISLLATGLMAASLSPGASMEQGAGALIVTGIFALVVSVASFVLFAWPVIAIFQDLVRENRFKDRPEEEVLIEEDLGGTYAHPAEEESEFDKEVRLQEQIDKINQDQDPDSQDQ
ncbi:MAG: glycerophosphoryl diester phosphodiesterase membrane domain-containing protein [Tissierellia bacterium]|nr:glycerophosphoryl diester phosphodiesterase membrane domain-containing protein [Tissierellia bacterium]